MEKFSRREIADARARLKKVFGCYVPLVRVRKLRPHAGLVVRLDNELFFTLKGWKWSCSYSNVQRWVFPGYFSSGFGSKKIELAIPALVALGLVEASDAKLMEFHEAEFWDRRERKHAIRILKAGAKELGFKVLPLGKC